MFLENKIHIFKTVTKSTFTKGIWHGIQAVIASSIVIFLNEKYWYKTAYWTTYLYYPLSLFKKHKKNNGIAFTRASILNTLLSFLTRANKPFPIPYTISGLELLENNDAGIVFCTTHLPLVKVAISATLTSGFKIDKAIVATPNTQELMPVWGITQKIPTIKSDKLSLLRAKNILSQKGCVLLMLDGYYGGKYSPNIMRLAGKLGSKAIFFLPELKPNGNIDIQIMQLPHPYCENEIAVTNNIQFVSDKVDQLLERYKSQSF